MKISFSPHRYDFVGLLIALVIIGTNGNDTDESVIDWRPKSCATCYNERVHLLVLHHTVTESAQATIDVLNKRGLSVHYIAAKNGSMYYAVDESKRAYHAGAGSWTKWLNLNAVSIGIEIVNSGAEPFPAVQVEAVAALSKKIVEKYKIKIKNIVGHADVAPTRKQDPSGYFDWKSFYQQIGVWDALFDSSLTPYQQKYVLLNYTTNGPHVRTLQNNLKTYGYGLEVNSIYDKATAMAVQAFNRHFCPEVFQKEVIDRSITVQDPRNWRWYALSEKTPFPPLTFHSLRQIFIDSEKIKIHPNASKNSRQLPFLSISFTYILFYILNFWATDIQDLFCYILL